MSTFNDFHKYDTSPLTASNQTFVPNLNEAGMNGSPSIVSLSGEFGAVVSWIRRRVGSALMEIEVSPETIAACFEEANLKFSSIVNSYFIQSWFASLLGIDKTYSQLDFQNALPKANNQFVQAFTSNFVNPMDSGTADKRKGYLMTTAGRGNYDFYSDTTDANSGLPLEQYVASVSGYDVHMGQVFYNSGQYMQRFFDPNNQQQQFLQSEFGFPSFPDGNHMSFILPINTDLLRGTLIKTSDYTRKTQVRYAKYGRVFELIPAPNANIRVWFEYWINYKPGTEESPLARGSFSGLDYLSQARQKVATNFGNIPVETMTYDNMNDIGRTWVREYTLATCFETLGLTRGKFQSMPLPGGDSITLNSGDLLNIAQTRRTELLTQLNQYLDNIDSYKIMEKEAAKAEQAMKLLMMQPMPIFMI